MNCRSITSCMILMLALLIVSSALPGVAESQTEGCQASASIPIIPSAGTTCDTAMVIGEEKNITIRVQNTSTTTESVLPVSAKLVGEITHIMACVDTNCAVELPGTLEFVPGPNNGCVSHAAGVLSCSALGNNRVVIDIDDPTGVTLDLTGPTTIAVIRVKAVAPVVPTVDNPCGRFSERAATDSDDVVTTDAICAAVATGAAIGSTNEFFPAVPPAVEITKSCDDNEQICTDQTITFDVSVTNTGPNTLTSCTVSDPDCTGAVPPITNLAPGASVSWTCTKTATVNVPVSNSASVSCTDVYGQPATDEVTSNECTVPPGPSVTAEKTCTSTSLACDATSATFNIHVCNDGPVAWTGTITDADCGISQAIALNAGACTDIPCTSSNVMSDMIVNNGGLVTVSANGCTDEATISYAYCELPPCQEAICRTPGYWKTHAGTEKRGSFNVTQDVIDRCGGCLDVCGTNIEDTALMSFDSALEAMCDNPGKPIFHLTAMALNCCISGFGPDCATGGDYLSQLFADANGACEMGESYRTEEVDCWNNGGKWQDDECWYGICEGTDIWCKESIDGVCNCISFPDNCHEMDLCSEDWGICYDGYSAGSSQLCTTAKKNKCNVLVETSQCSSGTFGGDCD